MERTNWADSPPAQLFASHLVYGKKSRFFVQLFFVVLSKRDEEGPEVPALAQSSKKVQKLILLKTITLVEC
jgi:hypothetical protein